MDARDLVDVLNALIPDPTTPKASPEFVETRGGVWLSVYLVEQCYGGPEEGGWWYTAWTHEGGLWFPTESAANEAKDAAAAEVAERSRQLARANARRWDALGDDDTVSSTCPEGYIPGGWSDGGEYQIVVETIAGVRDTRHQGRPRYE